MFELFYRGGPLFMSLISLVALGCIISIVLHYLGKGSLKWVGELGLLALTLGVLGQLIGLYEGFTAIEASGSQVGTAMIMGGLKVSMITTIYGLIVFGISLVYRVVSPQISK